MEAKAFLALANKLTQMRDEAALRSSVSRAYYAAYNSGIALVRQLGFPFEKGAPAHDKLYQYLNNIPISEVVDLANSLKALRKHRNEADYDMESPTFRNHSFCQLNVARAQIAVSQIEKFSQEPLRTQLRNGLQEYQTQIHS